MTTVVGLARLSAIEQQLVCSTCGDEIGARGVIVTQRIRFCGRCREMVRRALAEERVQAIGGRE